MGFVLWVATCIWTVYTTNHLWRILQLGQVPKFVDYELRQAGILQTVISQVLVLLFAISFMRAVFTDPGSVFMDESLRTLLSGKSVPGEALLQHQRELKQSGLRRYCKWCACYKPDRCHHCRMCGSCILRMDHHCPWIATCVGFRNHKYFFLLVFYSLLCCCYMGFTMVDTARRILCVSPRGGVAACVETSFRSRFALVFGMTLCTTMAMLLGTFLFFHSWLMLNGMTTIEFCEKKFRTGKVSSYNLGCMANVRQVLGPRCWLWLLPTSTPLGNGINFDTNRACEVATKDRLLSEDKDDIDFSVTSEDDDTKEDASKLSSPSPREGRSEWSRSDARKGTRGKHSLSD